jgi:hypothetical protein
MADVRKAVVPVVINCYRTPLVTRAGWLIEDVIEFLRLERFLVWFTGMPK